MVVWRWSGGLGICAETLRNQQVIGSIPIAGSIRCHATFHPKSRQAENMKKSTGEQASSPSERIDARIAELGDWWGTMLCRLRAVIQEADPEVVEEWT